MLHSPNQVNLPKRGSPRTKNAMKQFSINPEKCHSTVAKKAADSETSVKKAKVTKPKRLSNADVSEFLLKRNIKTENELMVIAKQRNDVGEKHIYNFIVNKTRLWNAILNHVSKFLMSMLILFVLKIAMVFVGQGSPEKQQN